MKTSQSPNFKNIAQRVEKEMKGLKVPGLRSAFHAKGKLIGLDAPLHNVLAAIVRDENGRVDHFLVDGRVHLRII